MVGRTVIGCRFQAVWGVVVTMVLVVIWPFSCLYIRIWRARRPGGFGRLNGGDIVSRQQVVAMRLSGEGLVLGWWVEFAFEAHEVAV